MDNTWGNEIFTIKTRQTHLLPLLDMKLKNIGAENQEFSIHMGEVCFKSDSI